VCSRNLSLKSIAIIGVLTFSIVGPISIVNTCHYTIKQSNLFTGLPVFSVEESMSEHRRRKVSKSVWAMASAVARAYNGGLGA